MSVLHSRLLPAIALGCTLGAPGAGFAADEPVTVPKRTPLRTDFIDAVYLPGMERVVITGHHGVVGTLEMGADGARLATLTDHPDEDFTALEKLSDSETLLGSASGRVYHFDGKKVTELAALSEFEEPVLDIAVDGSTIWVVGARGLVARSSDGKTFEPVEIRDVSQPQASFPAGNPADWYFGVSNLNMDTIQFNATVGGQPAVADTHYTMYPDEGFVQVLQPLDENPPPSISFTFSPGPPFRLGDVSWNVVLASGGKVTIAGEFGMILQSEDNGASWIRRDTHIVPREPEPAYWLGGVQRDDELWLVGAAGVSQVSRDGGVTWTENPKPGREGIFGIALLADGTPVIAGAVGLIGTLGSDGWKLADRTQLNLLSWLRTPVAMPDGSLLVTGGRATAIQLKDGNWERVPVEF